MEITRQKNNQTIIKFPLIDANNPPIHFTGTAWGSLTNEKVEYCSWSDTTVPISGTATNTPVESAVLGLWYLVLPAVDLNPNSGNNDYMSLKFSADEINPQTIIIQLTKNDPKEYSDFDQAVDIVATTISGDLSISGFATEEQAEDILAKVNAIEPEVSGLNGESFPKIGVEGDLITSGGTIQNIKIKDIDIRDDEVWIAYLDASGILRIHKFPFVQDQIYLTGGDG